MPRIVCHTAPLTADDITAMDGLWSDGVRAITAPLLTSVEQVVRRLRTDERIMFRFEDFERQHVVWQRVAPAAAIVQERRDDWLHRLHLLSRGPTGEVWWEKRIASSDDDDAGLLGFVVIVPAFTEWSNRSILSARSDS